MLSLRFTVAAATGGDPENYKLTETFDLPAEFVGDLGAAISARVIVSVAPAVHMAGQYLVPLMQAAAERLEPLVRNLSPNFDADTRAALQFGFALTQAVIGEQTGSNEALLTAIANYKAALSNTARDHSPLQWARTQNNLGNSLTTLSERETGTSHLEEAAEAYRAALLELRRESRPLDWALTQNNLGCALAAIGERETSTARLEEAVAAFRTALTEAKRERAPLQWAMTQNNLGNALQTLGEREDSCPRLEEAVEAYRAALLERTRERVPLYWATTSK